MGNWVGPAPLKIGPSMQVDGKCSNGTYNQATSFLDRVEGTCPADHPVFTGFSFLRCGVIDTGDEGLALRMTGCSLVPAP